MEYEDKSERWEFENYICVDKPELWVNEAINLKYSAIVLNEYTWNRTSELFDKKTPILDLPTFWTPGVERMLWGYAFENIFKAIIIVKLKKKEKIEDVPFPEIKSHDLLQLAKKANVTLSDDEKFYLKISQKCSVWAGRYPIPVKLHDLPQTRKPMKTREELFERHKKQHELLIQGKIKRIETENDILHSGVGALELKIYKDLFNRVQGLFNKAIKPQHITPADSSR